MPTDPDLLEDARNWVDKWPDAVGHTSVLSSFLMADEHWNADCWCEDMGNTPRMHVTQGDKRGSP